MKQDCVAAYLYLLDSELRLLYLELIYAGGEVYSSDSGLQEAYVSYLTAGAGKKGHHMGDYIPPEELEKFLAKCNDAMAQKAAKATAERAKIQADNVGHRLLSKMGWKEGILVSS
jgi:hypothetical protein